MVSHVWKVCVKRGSGIRAVAIEVRGIAGWQCEQAWLVSIDVRSCVDYTETRGRDVALPKAQLLVNLPT